MLGVELFHDSIQLGPKALGKLLASDLPTSLKALQGVLGKLNFAATFIPDFKRVIKPLVSLLSSRSDGRWTVECTDALNKVLHIAS